MNLPFSFRQKTKIALFLFCIMVCSILIRILEDKSIKNMGTAFASIYNDRLIPATDLFQLSQYSFGMQQLIEGYVLSEGQKDKNEITAQFVSFQLKTDSLLRKYEKTYLVDNEKGNLIALKGKLIEVKKNGVAMIKNSELQTPAQLKIQYHDIIKPSFDQITNSLANLTKIQSRVGAELIKESQEIMSGSRIYSSVQLILAITIGILIFSILFTTNIIKIKPTSFNLN